MFDSNAVQIPSQLHVLMCVHVNVHVQVLSGLHVRVGTWQGQLAGTTIIIVIVIVIIIIVIIVIVIAVFIIVIVVTMIIVMCMCICRFLLGCMCMGMCRYWVGCMCTQRGCPCAG